MIITTTSEQEERILKWSYEMQISPQEFIEEALERALEDWEDYIEARRLSAEVDAGRMKVYTLSEVERHLEEQNALES